jgi:hypothetical protein
VKYRLVLASPHLKAALQNRQPKKPGDMPDRQPDDRAVPHRSARCARRNIVPKSSSTLPRSEPTRKAEGRQRETVHRAPRMDAPNRTGPRSHGSRRWTRCDASRFARCTRRFSENNSTAKLRLRHCERAGLQSTANPPQGAFLGCDIMRGSSTRLSRNDFPARQAPIIPHWGDEVLGIARTVRVGACRAPSRCRFERHRAAARFARQHCKLAHYHPERRHLFPRWRLRPAGHLCISTYFRSVQPTEIGTAPPSVKRDCFLRCAVLSVYRRRTGACDQGSSWQ